MLFNSKNVSLFVAILVATLSTLSIFLANTEDTFLMVIVFLSSFASSYLINYVTFELLIFKEFKNFYKNLEDMKGNPVSSNFEDNLDRMNLKHMSDELFKFTSKKENEIKKLKKIEAFRREFLADISHELKTPIFAAQGYVETLLDGAMHDTSVRDKFLLKASKSLDNLDIIVRDLIVISHLETGEIELNKEYFDIAQLMKEEADQLEIFSKEKNVTMVNDIDNSLHTIVYGDIFRLGQVLMNLLNNAINYAGEGSIIKYRIKNKGNNSLLIEVNDNGIGINPKESKKIFQRFYRVDKSRSREKGGTGLGLSIVKHIIEAHKSEIKLQTEEGKGTTFSFELKKATKEDYED